MSVAPAPSSVVRGCCCSGLVSLDGHAGKDTGTGFTEASEFKAKKSSVAMLLPATNNRGSWDVLCVTACFISLPSKFPCTTGCSLSDQHNFCQIYQEQFALIFVNLMQISHHILGLLVIKYIDLKKNNLFHFYLHFGNRFLTIVTNVLCKSDENRSSYFGLIGEKIC